MLFYNGENLLSEVARIRDAFHDGVDVTVHTHLASNDFERQILEYIDHIQSSAAAKLRQVEERSSAYEKENLRIRGALDAVNANISLADEENKIVYTNNSVNMMFRNAESDIKKDLPSFSSGSVLGSSMDDYHKDPSYQRNMLKNLSSTYNSEISIGGRTFGLIANPVFGNNRERLGTVVEWLDKTEAIARQSEIDKMASENLRTKIALDNVATNVSIANTDGEIVYINKAIQQMFLTAESDIRKELPQFRATGVLGSNFDTYHKDPSSQRNMLGGLKDTYRSEIVVGGRTFALTANPVIDENGDRLGTVVEWADRTEELARLAREKRVNDENLRIKIALDNVSSNVTLASPDGEIIYANKAVLGMMSRNEHEIQKALPKFTVSGVIGSNFDVYHKNPSYQRNMLKDLNSTHYGQIEIGVRTFDLVANPVINDDGERIGTVVEWQDVSEELKAQNDIKDVIESAQKGELKSRINLAGKEGFIQAVSSGVNNLLDVVLEPVNEAVQVLQKMADGDLTDSVKGNYQGDHAIMKNALNSSLVSLNELMGQINLNVSQVSTGSNQLATTSNDLSKGAQQQAAAVEEISSTIVELTSQTNQNAESSSQADQLAQKVGGDADLGAEKMKAMLDAMTEINSASEDISKIIKVIDEIAFQTNLLALNAAVEAARAGEHGKGFAVVAEEVRNLAQRSANAAKETTELIETTMKRVEYGSSIANDTDVALGEIVQGIGKVSDIVGEIAAASKEQARGLDQVNEAIDSIDKVTQANSSGAEETAAASEELAAQATEVQDLISKFQIIDLASVGNQSNRIESFKKAKATGSEKRSFNTNEVISLDDVDFGDF